MEILLWLAPAAVLTALAMAWAAWAGRPGRHPAGRADPSGADQERFARAVTRAHPAAGLPRPAPVRDRSTGVAVRPSRGGAARTRRPA